MTSTTTTEDDVDDDNGDYQTHYVILNLVKVIFALQTLYLGYVSWIFLKYYD